MRRRLLITAATLLLVGLSASAQPPSRYATTAAALRASPVFYHGKQVALVKTF